MPFTATTAPSRSSDRASASASSAYDVARGRARAGAAWVRSRGQQTVWAWKRRSAGSAYSRRARGAHREAGHRGRRPVVGEPGRDRVARAAVGTGDERVPVAAVGRVAQVGQAVVADGHVGGDERASGRLLRLADDEARVLVGRDVLGGDGGHQGEGRGVVAESSHERFDVRGVPLDLGDDALAGVPHRARQVERPGQRVDMRPEPDALHHAARDDAASHHDRQHRLGHSNAPQVHVAARVGPVGGRTVSQRFDAGPTGTAVGRSSANLRLRDSPR